MKLSEYASHDAFGLAGMVRRKEVSPEELLEVALEASNKLNGALNAIVYDMTDIARRTAVGPIPDGPFRGVPFLLKDLTQSYADVPTNCGSRFFKGWTRPYDTELVKRWKDAGFVIFGKTNTPEGGSSGSTEPVANGPSHNPWNLDHSPGGSSGGSAAAVAAGIVPAAHANDGGGSIRIPASCCGLVGLKPSRGRTPNGPDLGELWNGLAIEHVVTRTVRDTAAILDLEWQPAVGDPYFAPPPLRPYIAEVGADPGRLRIGLTTRPLNGGPIDQACIDAAEDAAKLLADLGHTVEQAAPKFDVERMFAGWNTVFQAAEAWAFDGMGKVLGRVPSPENVEANNLYLVEAGRKVTGAQMIDALNAVHLETRAFAEFFRTYDMWLTPTLGTAPPRLGHLFADADAEVFFERLMAFIPFTPICNCTGHPGISLPLSWSSDGLPVGVHLAGRYADEAGLIRVAAQLEQARPWKDRVPPHSVWKS
jgi:amidase